MKIGESVRCPRCNSENPAEYRFCGMCGTPLDKAGEGSVRTPEPPARERVRQPAPESPQSLSGPSFLGLSGPAHGTEDVTYLFEEEQPKRSYGRFVLLLLILGVVGGLAWRQYTRSGRAWVAPWANQKPTAPAQAGQQPPTPTAPAQAGQQPSTPTAPAQAGQQPPAPTAPAQSSAPQPPPAATTAAGGQAGVQNPPANPPPAKETDLLPGTTQPAGSAPAQASPNATASPAPAEQPSQKNQSPTGNQEAANQPEPAPAEANAAKNQGSTEQPDTTEEAPATKAKPARVKPAPGPATSPDDALVANAEKYLYGRGVAENCDRALVSLRAAADRENARARTLLGTMYATGHCVPKDLPNAYRWFALASRQQSDNMWIQRNLEMIWREMTPQERQLAMQSNR